MKAFLIAAAALCGMVSAVPAAATSHNDRGGPMVQHKEHRTTTTVRKTTVQRQTNNGYGPKWRKKKVCRTVWRNEQRVRRCTWQRVRVR
jgi:hypothetical protein